uniref:Uncharacterized protein n=1 Tax=Mycena chlorophos TaxID=658473 RepID=A0ABQ0KZD3_MYCCL|nr:predicted protein [Mycena chlorophos]
MPRRTSSPAAGPSTSSEPTLVPLNLPGRSKDLPPLYQVHNHPLGLHNRIPGGRTFLCFTPGTKAENAEFWANKEGKMEVPKGTLTDILALGFLQLHSGDLVVVRSSRGGGLAMNDVPMVWVVGKEYIPQELLDRYEAARNEFLGPKKLRSLHRPVLKKTKEGVKYWDGGVAYERSPIAKSVKPPARSYTMGPSFETPTQMVAPVASVKAGDPDVEAAARLKQEFLEASTAIALAAMDFGPEKLKTILKDSASLRNVPSYGVHGNYAFGTSQVNVAGAQSWLSRTEAELKEDLGFFGGAHVDGKNSNGHLTHMMLHSHLPKGYTPGFFFILGLGVFVVTDAQVSVIFSGLRRHGGTPPLSPEDVADVENWAVRVASITYPPGALMNGMGRLRIGVWPNGEPLYLPPEVIYSGISHYTDQGHPNEEGTTNRTTFIREGIFMMQPLDLITFIVRALMLFVFFFLQHLDHNLRRLYPDQKYGLRFHPEQFENCITFEDPETHQRQTTPRWTHAPGWRDPDLDTSQPNVEIPADVAARQVDTDSVRSAAAKAFDEHAEHYWWHTPFLAAKGDPPKRAYKLDPSLKPEKRKRAPRTKPAAGTDPSAPTPKKTKRKRKVGGEKVSNVAKLVKQAKKKAKGKRRATDDDASYHDSDEDDMEAGMDWTEIVDEGPSVDVEMGEVEDEAIADDHDLQDSDSDEPMEVEVESGSWRGRTRSRGGKRLPSLVAELGPNAKRARSSACVLRSSTAFKSLAIGSDPPSSSSNTSGSSRQHNHWAVALISEDPSPKTAGGARNQLQRAVVRNPDRIRFVETLSTTRINDELLAVQQAMDAVLAGPVSTREEAQANLAEVYAALDDDPSSRSTAVVLAQFWDRINAADSAQAIDSLQLRLDHEAIMLSNYMAWSWLYGYCGGRIRAWLEHEPAPAGWIEELARDVKRVLQKDITSAWFASATYGLGITPRIFEYKNGNSRHFVDTHELTNAVATCCLRIIQTWFNYPDARAASRFQAYFVSSILDTLGRDALILDCVWKGYRQTLSVVLERTLAQDYVAARFQLLINQLRAHPLADPTSADSQAFTEIARMIERFRNPQALLPSPSPPGMLIDLPNVDTRLAQASEPNPVVLAPNPVVLVPNPHPALSLSTSNSLSSLSPLQTRRLAQFAEFLVEAWQIAYDEDDGQPSKWKTALGKYPDSLLPFRHLAPSLRHAYEADGPYAPANAGTEAGFYSALVFRGVTFNTPFSRTGRQVFADHADFEHAQAEAREREINARRPAPSDDSKFFCNKSAYGPANPARVVDLAATYHANASTYTLARMLNGSESVPFRSFWQGLQATKPWGRNPPRTAKGRSKPPPKQFPQLGPLASYLVAADYTYTNPRIVTPPTLEEMGATISSLNKGAARGLELLDLLQPVYSEKTGKPGKPSGADCTQALRLVCGYLQAHLSPEMLEDIGFDVVMIEHSLCKFSRAVVRNYITPCN